MKKLSFASPILLTTILLFAAACGKNTATETVPPPHTASEADFSEETSMNAWNLRRQNRTAWSREAQGSIFCRKR